MSRPTSEQEVEFLVNLQRLLTEGQFVATYKYALLMALADIAVEEGTDAGAPLAISTRAIAEKFILYYWRQSGSARTRSQAACARSVSYKWTCCTAWACGRGWPRATGMLPAMGSSGIALSLRQGTVSRGRRSAFKVGGCQWHPR